MVPTATPTVDGTVSPTMNPTECECPDEPLQLEWLGWNPRIPLLECQGDCDHDSDCEGDLLCAADVVPPGCRGRPRRRGRRTADYCYDPRSSSTTPTGARSGTLTVAGKDMAILVLMAMNAVSIVVVLCLCSRSKRGGKGKYEVVVATEGDSDLEEVPLRR